MKNTLEKYSEETLKVVSGLRLMDDNFMTIVFDRNTKAATFLLNTILERTDMQVIEVTAQREYKNPVSGGRSITLDIYAEDAQKKVYDIEIQRSDAGADAKRARFHSSMIDTRLLKEKQKFKEIHDSYVIFITENDIMKADLPLYHVERKVQETGILFGDGSHIIYVNGSYKDDQNPVGRLVHDFRCSSAADMLCPELADPVRYFKETEGGLAVVCKAFEEYGDKRAREAEIAMYIATCREFNVTDDEEMIHRVKIRFSLNDDAAREYVTGKKLA